MYNTTPTSAAVASRPLLFPRHGKVAPTAVKAMDGAKSLVAASSATCMILCYVIL